MTDILAIADGVLGIINANAVALDESFTAVRTYAPVYDAVTMQDLRIFVVPTGPQTLEWATRGEDQHTYTIMIGIYKSVAGDEIDGMVEFLGKVIDLFSTNNKLENPDCFLIDIKNESVFDPQNLDQRNLFVTVVELQYRLLR